MTENITNNAISDLAFAELNLHDSVNEGLATAGFTHCTMIQALTLPPALKGADVAGQAQTGTGKTAAFVLVIFERLLAQPRTNDSNSPRALVLAPTRELAIQIHKDAVLLGSSTGLTFGLAYGGVDYEKQRLVLQKGVDILIGTPGRIIDYFKQNVFNLKSIEVMVLDEADRMFDLGFIKDIRYVLRKLPDVDKRQCLLFSATLGQRVLELAYEHMNEPELLKVESESITAENVRQVVYYPSNEEKMPLLAALLRRFMSGRVMVFTNTRAATDRVERTLNANGFHAAAISGAVTQKKRETLLGRFHAGEIPILVAAVNPYMCRVAAEVGDGVRLHPVCTPAYINDTLIPAMDSYRSEGFEVCLKPLIATAPDQKTLAERIEVTRAGLAFYCSTPAYANAFAVYDLQDLCEEMAQLSRQQRWDEMSARVDDELLHRFVVVSLYEDLATTIAQRFGDGIIGGHFVHIDHRTQPVQQQFVG